MKTNMMCLLVLGSLSAFAQNDPPAGQSTPEKSCGLKISSFNIGSGTSFYKSDGTDLNSMKSLASISSTTLFNTPVDGYNLRSNHMFDARQVNLSIGFNPYDSKTGTYNKKRELLVGVTYQWGSRSSLNYSQNTTAVGDTFASGINKIYSDTVKKSKIRYTEKLGELDLNVAYLYKTDPDKRFSLYTGYGILLGYTISSEITQLVSDASHLTFNLNDASVIHTGNNRLSNDRTFSKTDMAKSILFKPYVPIGVNMRLCKNHPIFNKMNLFLQTQLGVEYQQFLSNSNHNITPFVNFSGGFKYNF